MIVERRRLRHAELLRRDAAGAHRDLGAQLQRHRAVALLVIGPGHPQHGERSPEQHYAGGPARHAAQRRGRGEQHDVEPGERQRGREKEAEQVELRREPRRGADEVGGHPGRHAGHHPHVPQPDQPDEEGEGDDPEPVERRGGPPPQRQHALRSEQRERREQREQVDVLRRPHVRRAEQGGERGERRHEKPRLVQTPSQRPHRPGRERPGRPRKPASGGKKVTQVRAERSLRLRGQSPPFPEELGRARVKRERPADRERAADDEAGRPERQGIAAAPFRAGEVGRDDREAERRRRDPGRGEESQAERGAEQGAGRDRPRRCPRQHGERAAQRGEAGELRQRLVRVHDEADRADENQKRGCGGGAARLRGSPVARRPVEQPARREQERAAREPRRGVELDEVLEELPEGERHPVIQRRIVQPDPRSDVRHEQIAPQGHVVHDADA